MTWRQLVVRACPLWYLYTWHIRRWISHDCEENPIICRTPCGLGLGFLDRWQYPNCKRRDGHCACGGWHYD